MGSINGQKHNQYIADKYAQDLKMRPFDYIPDLTERYASDQEEQESCECGCGAKNSLYCTADADDERGE